MSVEQAEKKQLLLINPVPLSKDRLSNSAVGRKIPPQSLFILEALTPKNEWTVQIIDEGEKPFDMRELTEPPFFVGITCMTDQAPQAYRIAEAFRQKGVPVILGGAHPTVLPKEALRYADAVCIGEVESVWLKILADAQDRGLQPVYQEESMISLDQVPILRHPGRDKYKYGAIQTARGCPYNCEFCSVTAINGAQIRYRPIGDVVKEFAGIKQKWVLVADDNFIGTGPRGLNRALRLSQALAELRQQGIKKYWATQATQILGGSEYNELLTWMYKAGCRAVLLGLESINKDVNAAMKKGINTVGDYKEHIRNIQNHRIAVIGSFFFGSDLDSPTVFDDTVRFIKDSGAAAQNLNLLCPFPGTRIFDELFQSGYLRYTDFPADWERYNLKDVVINPKNCTPLELYEKRKWAEYQLNNKLALLKRTSRTLWETRSLYATMIALLWNMGGSLRMRDYRDQIKQLEEETRTTTSNTV